jgi:hypothetical protein
LWLDELMKKGGIIYVFTNQDCLAVNASYPFWMGRGRYYKFALASDAIIVRAWPDNLNKQTIWVENK